MKLHVQVSEARNLAARDANGLSDPFVRLQLGNTKTKTSVVMRNLNPAWHDEFFFNVVESDEELLVMVWDEDRFTDNFLGQVKIPVSRVLTAEKQTISSEWFTLQKRSEKSKFPVTGEILLSLSLFGKDTSGSSKLCATSKLLPKLSISPPLTSIDDDEPMLSPTSSVEMSDSSTDASNLVDVPVSPTLAGSWSTTSNSNHEENSVTENDSAEGRHNKVHKSLADRFSSVFNKKLRRAGNLTSKHSGESSSSSSTPKFSDSPGEVHPFSDSVEPSSDDEVDSLPPSFFADDDKSLGSCDDEFPPPLTGGVVLDQRYAAGVRVLNSVIFKPGSSFIQDISTALKTTQYREEPWRKCGLEPYKRAVSYMQAATKLVKSVKATETQTYTRADDRGFVVNISCSTPDVPFGGNFIIELQFSIMAEPNLPTGEKTCRLEVSWKLKIVHQTMMKGIIENGARQGIKENYKVLQEILGNYVRPISMKKSVGVGNDDETPLSEWELMRGYFGNYPVLLAVLCLLIVLLHIWFAPPSLKRTLRKWGFDLPDSVGQLVMSAIVVLQIETVVKMVYQFLRARYWQSGDHGVKALGDGWLMTVTLIAGENLAPTEASAYSNPYVVFTCNGRRRTSSVKLRNLNPLWREIFEFDATEDPPSTMDVEVFDYDGPFSDAESLGHAEINFLKQSPNNLSDFWVSLSGKNARTHGSKLHLRVFLTNTKESDALPEYLERVEKEVGTKVAKRSAQRNASFQKLFSLPAEEFLINDYACAIKRKILIQGRLFLSPRVVGFYSNLFGIKTKFTFMWEDIEEIKESPSINPSLLLFLRKGRGLDARNGARGVDERGRVKFQFLSFVRSGTAFKTITALWKNRKLSPEQQLELVADVEASDRNCELVESVDRPADDTESFLAIEEACMTPVVSFDIPITAECVKYLFEKENLDEVVNEKIGRINYKTSPWERVEGQHGVTRRQLSYSLNRQISQFGSKVSCIQQKTLTDNLSHRCIIDEIVTLHDVPFGDHFQVQIRKDVETLSSNPPTSLVKASVGVAWHKNTEFKKKINKNVHDHMAKQIRELMNVIVKEIKVAMKDDKWSVRNGA